MPWSFGKREDVVISENETRAPAFSEKKLQQELEDDRAEKAKKQLEAERAKAEAETIARALAVAQEQRKVAEAMAKRLRLEVKEEERRRRTLDAEMARVEIQLLLGLLGRLSTVERDSKLARKEVERQRRREKDGTRDNIS